MRGEGQNWTTDDDQENKGNVKLIGRCPGLRFVFNGTSGSPQGLQAEPQKKKTATDSRYAVIVFYVLHIVIMNVDDH